VTAVSPPRPTRRIACQGLALALGTASGGLAYVLHMPLPWMLGAMFGTTVAALAGLPVHAPNAMRPLVIPVLGVLLGSSMRAEVLAGAVAWIPSLLLLPVFLGTAGLLGASFYRRVGGYAPVTAFFAAMPGGLNDMIIIGGAMGADERKVAMAHAVRVLFAITLIALFFGLVLGASSRSGSGGGWTPITAVKPDELAWLAGAAILGGWIGNASRLPAGGILIPMALSGALHIAGTVAVPPPSILVVIAQIVMGTTVGCRFAGTALAEIRRDLLLGVATSGIVVSATLTFSILVHVVTGIALSQAFLAYAPGGLSEMSLIALAMGEDVAYVSVMHITRVVTVIFCAPLVFRLSRRGRSPAG
jgi:membrane AbrB-like protein